MSQTRANSIANQFAFKFRDAGEYSEHQAPVRGGCVDAFMQTDEINPESAKLLQSIDQLTEGSGEPVIAVNDNRVHVPLAALGEQSVEFWPTGTVTFLAGSTTLGTVALSSGKAAISTSTLPKGPTTIKATYNGTPNIIGSVATLVQQVN